MHNYLHMYIYIYIWIHKYAVFFIVYLLICFSAIIHQKGTQVLSMEFSKMLRSVLCISVGNRYFYQHKYHQNYFPKRIPKECNPDYPLRHGQHQEWWGGSQLAARLQTLTHTYCQPEINIYIYIQIFAWTISEVMYLNIYICFKY